MIKCCGCECQREVLDLETVPESALKVELDKRQSTDALPAPPSCVGQALRMPRRTPRPPARRMEVELTATNSENV